MRKREEKKRWKERHSDVRKEIHSSRRGRVRLHAKLARKERSKVLAVRARSAAHNRERGATVCRAACSS
eukprot:1803618-Rhodomonas_salina.1